MSDFESISLYLAALLPFRTHNIPVRRVDSAKSMSEVGP